jgi:hypothetical protein
MLPSPLLPCYSKFCLLPGKGRILSKALLDCIEGNEIAMTEFISLEGPVEMWNGEFTLRIPLDAGGAALMDCVRGIGQSDGEYLNIVIKPWLAEKLQISNGSIVIVDNRDGKFNITRSEANDTPSS